MQSNPIKEKLKGQIIQTVEGDGLTPDRFENGAGDRTAHRERRMRTQNQRIIEANFTGAQIVGDDAWLCLSDCGLFQIAYLFPTEIQRDTKMLKCGNHCKGQNHHTARQIALPRIAEPTCAAR